MRVVMPLFSFQYFEEQDFEFSDGKISIQCFTGIGNLVGQEILSDRDRLYIGKANKALVAQSDDLLSEAYKSDVDLLLMTFRILGDRMTPIIKYRLSDNETLCARINQIETKIYLPGYLYQTYTAQDFSHIDIAYMTLRKAEHTSIRLDNAFFFLARAFKATSWIESFLLLMNSLESLFSKDQGGAATKTIVKRVSNLMSDTTNWTEQTIADLYHVRSRITHGNIVASKNPDENLLLNSKMEKLAKACFRKLIALNAFPHFATSSSRDLFLSQFD